MSDEEKRTDAQAPGFKKYPDHSVVIEKSGKTVFISVGSSKLCFTQSSILLTETGYEPVYYCPREDIDFIKLKELDQTTYCPFKGEARYWALKEDEQETPILWGYDTPYEEVRGLDQYAAFYSDRTRLQILS